MILQESDDLDQLVCLYVTGWLGDHKVEKTFVDTGALLDLVSPDLVATLGLQPF